MQQGVDVDTRTLSLLGRGPQLNTRGLSYSVVCSISSIQHIHINKTSGANVFDKLPAPNVIIGV